MGILVPDLAHRTVYPQLLLIEATGFLNLGFRNGARTAPEGDQGSSS